MITHVNVQNAFHDIFSGFCSAAYMLRKGIGNGTTATGDIAVCSHHVDFMLVVPSSDNRVLGSRNTLARHPAISDQNHRHSNDIKALNVDTQDSRFPCTSLISEFPAHFESSILIRTRPAGYLRLSNNMKFSATILMAIVCASVPATFALPGYYPQVVNLEEGARHGYYPQVVTFGEQYCLPGCWPAPPLPNLCPLKLHLAECSTCCS